MNVAQLIPYTSRDVVCQHIQIWRYVRGWLLCRLRPLEPRPYAVQWKICDFNITTSINPDVEMLDPVT